jgi:hypothetical protein
VGFDRLVLIPIIGWGPASDELSLTSLPPAGKRILAKFR